jgi:hypothetical protein
LDTTNFRWEVIGDEKMLHKVPRKGGRFCSSATTIG